MFARQASALAVFGTLADDVDQPTWFQGTIKQRRWPLEHLDPLGGGVEVARQVAAHAIAQSRPVGVGTKAAFDEAILSTGQCVALCHAANEFHRIVQRSDLKVLDGLWCYHLH